MLSGIKAVRLTELTAAGTVADSNGIPFVLLFLVRRNQNMTQRYYLYLILVALLHKI
jgi:hypothetical protein